MQTFGKGKSNCTRSLVLCFEVRCPGEVFSEPESTRSTMFSGPRVNVERSGGGSCDADAKADEDAGTAEESALFESDQCGDETDTFSTRVGGPTRSRSRSNGSSVGCTVTIVTLAGFDGTLAPAPANADDEPPPVPPRDMSPKAARAESASSEAGPTYATREIMRLKLNVVN